ncbi:MAG: hypothetical protein ACREXW_11190 [Gammaproteobacteria bacterium]
MLKRCASPRLKRADKGGVLCYLRQQRTRLVRRCHRRAEAYLVLVKAMLELEGFPFTISGFHAGNCSEYINIARLLERGTSTWQRTAPAMWDDGRATSCFSSSLEV